MDFNSLSPRKKRKIRTSQNRIVLSWPTNMFFATFKYRFVWRFFFISSQAEICSLNFWATKRWNFHCFSSKKEIFLLHRAFDALRFQRFLCYSMECTGIIDDMNISNIFLIQLNDKNEIEFLFFDKSFNLFFVRAFFYHWISYHVISCVVFRLRFRNYLIVVAVPDFRSSFE